MNNTKLASIEQITDIIKHEEFPNSDVLIILNQKVITKKGQFNKGELCIFINSGTNVDSCREYFKSLTQNGETRVQVKPNGIALPISLYFFEPELGKDVSSFFDIKINNKS